MTLQFDPTWFMANFVLTQFDAWLRKVCNDSVTDIPLDRYKWNLSTICDLPEKWLVLCGVFPFFAGYIFLCLPAYNSKFQYFKMKSSVPSTSNLWDFTVIVKIPIWHNNHTWGFYILHSSSFIIYYTSGFQSLACIYSKTCLNQPLSKDQKLAFKINFCLKQIKSIAECSLWNILQFFRPSLSYLKQFKSIAECSKGSILQFFRPSLSYHSSLRSWFCLFLSGRLTQVLLYKQSLGSAVTQWQALCHGLKQDTLNNQNLVLENIQTCLKIIDLGVKHQLRQKQKVEQRTILRSQLIWIWIYIVFILGYIRALHVKDLKTTWYYQGYFFIVVRALLCTDIWATLLNNPYQ